MAARAARDFLASAKRLALALSAAALSAVALGTATVLTAVAPDLTLAWLA